MENEIVVYSVDKFEPIQKLQVDKLLAGLYPLVTNLKMYSDNHLIVQNFDGAISVINYHETKVCYQRLDSENRTALDNDVVIVDKNVYYSRKNMLFLLKRTPQEWE